MTAIHLNSDGEKFQCLNTLVDGEPFHYISGLPQLDGWQL